MRQNRRKFCVHISLTVGEKKERPNCFHTYQPTRRDRNKTSMFDVDGLVSMLKLRRHLFAFDVGSYIEKKKFCKFFNFKHNYDYEDRIISVVRSYTYGNNLITSYF